MSDPGANVPSLGLDPANDGSLGGAFRAIFRKLLQNVDDMLPATVIAATPDRNFVTVQPLILIVGTSGTTNPRAQIAKVPVLTMGAGNWVQSFPITPQDLGWIKASDRDISLYLQSNTAATPNDGSFHDFKNGLFIPDKARQWALAEEDATNAVWQSLDGTIKITLGTDKIKISHPTLVEIDAPQTTVNGKFTVTGDTSFGGGAQALKRADNTDTTTMVGT